jgi:hypothetical protein
MGSTRVSRVGFGVAPKQSFGSCRVALEDLHEESSRPWGRVRQHARRALPLGRELGRSDDARWNKS